MDDLVQAVVDEVLRRQGQRPALHRRKKQAVVKWQTPKVCHCEEAQPTWQSRRTRSDYREAIGENATAFPRLPRRFAPRNDTSGSAVVYQRPPTVELPCTGRSLPARGTPHP